VADPRDAAGVEGLDDLRERARVFVRLEREEPRRVVAAREALEDRALVGGARAAVFLGITRTRRIFIGWPRGGARGA
jgi:hypothetical protein